MSRKVPRALLCYAPAARHLRRGLRRKLDALAARFRDRQVILDTLASDAPGDLLEHADSVAGREYDLLVAWGGDGTVNETGNLAGRLRVPLGILPGGTVNVLARELGIPPALDRAADVLFHGGLRTIRAGRAGGRLFFTSAGAGFDAAVCRWVSPALKRRLGRAAYALGGVRLLLTYPFSSLTVQCGPMEFTGTQFIISNVPRYAGTFRLAPLADLDGAALDLCLLRSDTASGYLRFLARLLIGRHTRWRDLVHLKGWTFSAFSSEPVPVQVDGDYAGTLPMQFEIVPDALDVLVPAAGPAPRPSPLAPAAA